MPLIVNHKNINTISGPVSMTILSPHIEVAKQYHNQNNMFMPILILFGDQHYSTEHMCTKCNQKGGCHAVYDLEFIEQFDSLASKHHPIDIFVEGLFFDKYVQHVKFSDIGEPSAPDAPLTKFLTDYLPCYQRNTKECPTDKLRWHFCDARQLSLKFDIKRDIVRYLPKYRYETYLSSIISWIKPLLQLYVDKRLTKDYIESVAFDMIQHNFGSNIKFYRHIIQMMKLQLTEPESFIDAFLFQSHKFVKKHSIIMKQIRKQKYKPYNKEFFQVAFRNYFLQIIVPKANKVYLHNGISTDKFHKFINLFIDICEELLNVYQSKTNNIKSLIKSFFKCLQGDVLFDNIIEILYEYIVLINSVMLDMYFINRLFKKPKNDKNSVLSIAYLGNFHIVNLINWFETTLNYNVVFHKNMLHYYNDDEPNRCIDIPSYINIDMDEMVTNYSSK